jgi:hypothetical protein
MKKLMKLVRWVLKVTSIFWSKIVHFKTFSLRKIQHKNVKFWTIGAMDHVCVFKKKIWSFENSNSKFLSELDRVFLRHDLINWWFTKNSPLRFPLNFTQKTVVFHSHLRKLELWNFAESSVLSHLKLNFFLKVSGRKSQKVRKCLKKLDIEKLAKYLLGSWKFGFKCLSQINRKFRVPRKQGAHFWGQIQDSWVFSSSAWNFRSLEYNHA